MKALESLDLSMNNLSGVIPHSISSISFLSYLNLRSTTYLAKSRQAPKSKALVGLASSAIMTSTGLHLRLLMKKMEQRGRHKPMQMEMMKTRVDGLI